MKSALSQYAVVGLLALVLLAFGATGHAYKEMASQKAGKGCGGCSKYGHSGGCGKQGDAADLTQEQRELLDAERRAFMAATKEERETLYGKRTALWEELDKEQPDAQKASMLQEEISQLRASLDQKMLAHMIAVRKIHPDAGKRFFMEHGGGYGKRTGAADCPYKK